MKWDTKCKEREERRGVNEMEGVKRERVGTARDEEK